MKIIALEKKQYDVFKAMFCDYYAEMDSDENVPHLLDEYVLPDYEAELITIALAIEESSVVGFVIFQIDGIENDWCIHEGWGDVRELYVKKERRLHGVGTALLQFAERELEGLPLFLLPDETCESFFTKNGFADSGEYESDTGCKIFVKGI